MRRHLRAWPRTLAVALVAGVTLIGWTAAPAHAVNTVHDGWCKKNEGMAIVIAFDRLPAQFWQNAQGYVVKCIVDPVRPAGPNSWAWALDVAGIPYTGNGYAQSIFGITDGTPIFGWDHGKAIDGTLTWGPAQNQDFYPNPLVNGFEYFAGMPDQMVGSIPPAVNPQFAPDGGGGGGAGNDPLNPDAPNQTYVPGPGNNNGGGAPGGNVPGGGGGNGVAPGGGGGGGNGPGGGPGGPGGAGNAGQTPSASSSASPSPAPSSAAASAAGAPSSSPSASPSPSESALYSREVPQGAAGGSRQAASFRTWVWAGIGAVVVAAGATLGGMTIYRRRRAAEQAAST